MKIGLITLVGNNYGNKYQNYAAERLLMKYGQVVTYRVQRTTDTLEVTKQTERNVLKRIFHSLDSRMLYYYDINNGCRSTLGNLLYLVTHKKEIVQARLNRSDAFKMFNETYLHVSDRVITRENCNDKIWQDQHDAFVCGSDQIWNPYYPTTSELAFLSFAGEKKKIALSPSIGVNEIPEQRKELYKKYLPRLDRISVREKRGREIIKEITGLESVVLADPTLALNEEEWLKVSRKPSIQLPEKYVLCYFLGKYDKAKRAAVQEIAKGKGMKIVRLFNIEQPDVYALDPSEVLYLISHATMVATDSYHGTVFSIIFHKPFRVFDRNESGKSMNSRFQTLLSTSGLDPQRETYDLSDSEWERIDTIREIQKNKIETYIQEALAT